ncbi:MAG: DUF1292 domain-containing protein [Christensenellales bacterium]
MENSELISTVKLTDENGREVTFDHLLTFDYEKRRFIALMPMDEVEGIGEDEVLLLCIEQDENGKDVYVPVENEILLNEAFDRFLELMDELEEEEDE